MTPEQQSIHLAGELARLQGEVSRLERELEQERRSPYIDSDESPVEVLAAIYDALDGITDDAANGHNFGTLVSRVRAAARDAKECEQARQDARQSELDCLRALGERNDERQRADRMAAWLVDYLRKLDWVYDPSCSCPDCEFVRGIKTALGETEP